MKRSGIIIVPFILLAMVLGMNSCATMVGGITGAALGSLSRDPWGASAGAAIGASVGSVVDQVIVQSQMEKRARNRNRVVEEEDGCAREPYYAPAPSANGGGYYHYEFSDSTEYATGKIE